MVHAHGSDVRSASRAQRAALAAVWRESALRIVATPDLLTDVPGSVYLPNPIDVERFQQIGDLVPDRDVLVFAALTSIKGADVLVDAVRLIKSQRPDCTVTALAGGPFESAMHEAGAVISDRVTASELPAFIGRHRVVLGQQFLGALGVADLEAMATARPVVMNLRTDLAYESVPPIVNAGDAQSIASATSALLDDPNMRASIGSSCSRWVDQYHRTDRVVEELLAMYAAALPGKF